MIRFIIYLFFFLLQYSFLVYLNYKYYLLVSGRCVVVFILGKMDFYLFLKKFFEFKNYYNLNYCKFYEVFQFGYYWFEDFYYFCVNFFFVWLVVVLYL